jgi:hypothetical protein
MIDKEKKIIYFIRKWKMFLFNRGHIKDRIKSRKGKCKMCGKCCQLSIMGISFRCPFLDSNNRCRIYKIRKYLYPFLSCHLTPIDESDLFEGCGYYWDKGGKGR